MDKIGLYVPEHVSSHGQLYMALFRVCNPTNVTILASKGQVEGQEGTFTNIVVYKEEFGRQCRCKASNITEVLSLNPHNVLSSGTARDARSWKTLLRITDLTLVNNQA